MEIGGTVGAGSVEERAEEAGGEARDCESEDASAEGRAAAGGEEAPLLLSPMARAEQSGADDSSGTAAAPSSAPQLALQAFVAADPKTLQLIENVRRIAASASTVLIRGESGTGKELLASLLHYLGPKAHEPLVKIDCASLPHELVESELFGYEPGAFTGATQRKRGRLELAAGGTIVLDEIAALSMPAQAKLLRVIEEKKFMRLGG